MMYRPADTCNNGVLMILLLLVVSTNAHFIILERSIIRSLSDRFNEEVPYQLTTEFLQMCKHVPTNCDLFLWHFNSTLAEMFIPSVGPVKHLQLINTTIGMPNEIAGATNCFKYVPKGDGLNELYALCLKDQPHETTLVSNKLEYDEDFRIALSHEYVGEYGSHIDMHSPLIVTYDEFTGPVVLYIANARGEDMLYIKHLNAGKDVHSTKPLPSNCTGPYELQHLYQLYALLKCSNGFVHIYDVDMGEFSKLPVHSIAMIDRCANSSSSFVMLTDQGNILLNNTASEPLIRILSFKISTNFQLNAVSSFTCHWNGTVTTFYATVSQDDGFTHYVSIPLEYAAGSKAVVEPHQMLKLSNREPLYSFDMIRSSIVGSTWVIKLFDSGHSMQETVLIDIITENSDSHISEDLAYVLSLKSVLKHKDDDDQGGLNVNPPTSDNTNEPRTLIIGISVVVVTVFAIAVIIVITLLVIRKRYLCNSQGRLRRGSYSTMQRTGQRLPESHELATYTSDPPDHNLNEAHDPAAPYSDVSVASDQCSHADEGDHQTATDDHLPASDDHDDNQRPTNDQNVNINVHDGQISSSSQFSSTRTLVPATSESADQGVDTPSQWVVAGLPMPIGDGMVLHSTNSFTPRSDNSNRDADDETEMPSNN